MKTILQKVNLFFRFFLANRLTFVSFLVFTGLALCSVFASVLSPSSPYIVYEEFLNLPPFWMEQGIGRFPLGTDDLGRDLLSRLLYGGRISFFVGFFVMGFSLLFGILFGVLSGFFQKLDPWIMGAVDILMSFPGILTAIIVVAVIGPGLINSCIAVTVMSLPFMIRLVRSLIFRERARSYVEASRNFGSGSLRIIGRHILPNSMGEIFVQSLLNFSEGILNVAALGFLGLGAEAPLPEWGVMVADGRSYIQSSWWLITFPGLCILTVVLCMNILGESLKKAFLKGS